MKRELIPESVPQCWVRFVFREAARWVRFVGRTVYRWVRFVFRDQPFWVRFVGRTVYRWVRFVFRDQPFWVRFVGRTVYRWVRFVFRDQPFWVRFVGRTVYRWVRFVFRDQPFWVRFVGRTVYRWVRFVFRDQPFWVRFVGRTVYRWVRFVFRDQPCWVRFVLATRVVGFVSNTPMGLSLQAESCPHDIVEMRTRMKREPGCQRAHDRESFSTILSRTRRFTSLVGRRFLGASLPARFGVVCGAMLTALLVAAMPRRENAVTKLPSPRRPGIRLA